jgi:galactokinase
MVWNNPMSDALSSDDLGISFSTHFGRQPMAVASAHGRANLIGEHTDYNDGLVLPCLIGNRIEIALAMRDDDRICGISNQYAAGQKTVYDGRDGHWLDFVVGALHQLLPVGGRLQGLDVAVKSDIPSGAGVSSSAALEIALLRALVMGQQLICPTNVQLARMAQRIEHDFIGTQCGIMDQMVVAAATPGDCMLLDCRSLAYELMPLLPGYAVAVIHSGSVRKLLDSVYNQRLAECKAAARMLGVGTLRDADGEMLAKFATTTEMKRAKHVISENARVQAAVECLARNDPSGFGHLMDESHASLCNDYEVSSPELDRLVASLRHAGALGARLTGAGFGGCVVALCETTSAATVVSSAVEMNPGSYLIDLIGI